MPKTLPPLHPGEVLREEYLQPLGLSPYAVAVKAQLEEAAFKQLNLIALDEGVTKESLFLDAFERHGNRAPRESSHIFEHRRLWPAHFCAKIFAPERQERRPPCF
jgi:hypothetical protein